jgi:hypothetical protein
VERDDALSHAGKQQMCQWRTQESMCRSFREEPLSPVDVIWSSTQKSRSNSKDDESNSVSSIRSATGTQRYHAFASREIGGLVKEGHECKLAGGLAVCSTTDLGQHFSQDVTALTQIFWLHSVRM